MEGCPDRSREGGVEMNALPIPVLSLEAPAPLPQFAALDFYGPCLRAAAEISDDESMAAAIADAIAEAIGLDVIAARVARVVALAGAGEVVFVNGCGPEEAAAFAKAWADLHARPKRRPYCKD